MGSTDLLTVPDRLAIPNVTLCAAASVNVEATLAALRASLFQADFEHCLLFTDAIVAPDDPRISVVPIKRLNSAEDYSSFILGELVDHLTSEYCLIVQWDGFVLDASRWERSFLDYDYIGAVWPQFHDGFDVGNGGFSLRSRRLLEACRDKRFKISHPEDVAIGRRYRPLLEQEFGVRFADRATAERFAFERARSPHHTFGFHGVFNMISALGDDHFWQIYSSLDDRKTAFVDFWPLFWQLKGGRNVLRRRMQMVWDRTLSLVGR